MLESTDNEVNKNSNLKIIIVAVGSSGVHFASHLLNEDINDIDFKIIRMFGSDWILEHYGFTKLNPAKVDTIAFRNPTNNFVCRSFETMEIVYNFIKDKQQEIKNMLLEADVAIIVTGLGGTTSSAVTPFVAKVAKEMGIFTILISRMPIKYDTKRKKAYAKIALEELNELCDFKTIINENRYMTPPDNINFDNNLKTLDCAFQKQLINIVNIVRDSNKDTILKNLNSKIYESEKLFDTCYEVILQNTKIIEVENEQKKMSWWEKLKIWWRKEK